ncbi:hypothetical protein [Ehrlichia japonica]|uniref:hypothetical protein n=1 Tax=Ehrlichia japonica TaxID=391036 RepID=UPI00069375E0|nr:hypothetical protein [Ehrlichia japonica]
MFFFKKATHKTKFYIALCANVIYFGVFLFAIFIQLIRFPSKLSVKDLLLINLLMVLSARIMLCLLSYYELACTHYTDDKNSLMKYKKVAHTTEAISTTIAIIIQVIAIYQVAAGNLEIVSSKKTAIHTKGAVDFACILIKLLIVSPLLIYFNYHRMNKNKHITHTKNMEYLFYLSLVSLVISFIAFAGKIINVLEQTQYFTLFDTENHSNNGPNNFPLGPIIRISCIAASIILFTIMFSIESSINSTLSDTEIQYEHKTLNNTVSG